MRKAALVAALFLAICGGCGHPSAAPPVAAPKPTASPVRAVAHTPAPRVPSYESMEDTYLLHNKIYSAGQVPAVACVLPDLDLRTRQDVQKYSNAVLVCLERAWKPVVERADIAFLPTTVYAVGEGARTACGPVGGDEDAFYCEGNTAIYVDWKSFVEDQDYDKVWSQTYVEFVMAHEFGHHVQEMVGISGYYDDRWDRTTGAAQLEQTRRHELQATCFAAAFLGANQQTLDLYDERYAAYEDAAYVGDEDAPSSPRDHGSGKSSTYWSKAAFAAKSPSACNTWLAAPKRVS